MIYPDVRREAQKIKGLVKIRALSNVCLELRNRTSRRLFLLELIAGYGHTLRANKLRKRNSDTMLPDRIVYLAGAPNTKLGSEAGKFA